MTTPPPVHVILVCPCCASTVDAEPEPDQAQRFECLQCGQVWIMTVNINRFTKHSLI